MSESMQPCPYCRKEIDAQARKCPFCQTHLTVAGRFRGFEPVLSLLLAAGGLVFGYYELEEAKEARRELEMEQAALLKVLNSVPPETLKSKYDTSSSSVTELNKELRRDPKNLDARIKLRMLQRAHTGAGKKPLRIGTANGKSRQ